MSEKDRCYTVVEELELELRMLVRMLERVIGIYEADISKLKQKNYFLEAEIKELKKDKYKLQIAIERGIS